MYFSIPYTCIWNLEHSETDLDLKVISEMLCDTKLDKYCSGASDIIPI